jgi:hypothetical protein
MPPAPFLLFLAATDPGQKDQPLPPCLPPFHCRSVCTWGTRMPCRSAAPCPAGTVLLAPLHCRHRHAGARVSSGRFNAAMGKVCSLL